MFKRPEEERAAFYRRFNKTESQIFPITFAAALGLASGHVAGKLDGFYVSEKGRLRCYR